MTPEHSFELHLSNDPVNDWRGAQTLDTFGEGSNGQPLMALQQTPGGKGRVIFNELLLTGAGLTMLDIREALQRASVANQLHSAYDPTRFVGKPVVFEENSLGGSNRMVFEGFLEQGFSSRVWQAEAAPFSQLPKAQAFFDFVKDNLPRAIAHFPQEMGTVGDKLRQSGLPIPASSAPVLPLNEVVARYEARQPTPNVPPAPSQGPRGPKA